MVAFYTVHSAKKIPNHLRKWLLSSGSLTKKLTQLAGGEFYVQRKKEGYQKLNVSECQLLDMPYVQLAWVREVELYGTNGQAWVKARSIIPMKSVQNKAKCFQALKNRPMGHLLFHRYQPKCERQVFKTEDGWMRQSCYTWYGCKLIVQETFLAAFEQHIR